METHRLPVALRVTLVRPPARRRRVLHPGPRSRAPPPNTSDRTGPVLRSHSPGRTSRTVPPLLWRRDTGAARGPLRLRLLRKHGRPGGVVLDAPRQGCSLAHHVAKHRAAPGESIRPTRSSLRRYRKGRRTRVREREAVGRWLALRPLTGRESSNSLALNPGLEVIS